MNQDSEVLQNDTLPYSTSIIWQSKFQKFSSDNLYCKVKQGHPSMVRLDRGQLPMRKHMRHRCLVARGAVAKSHA